MKTDDLAYAVTEKVSASLEADRVQIFHCVNQLDDAQLWWRPCGGNNAIGNLILHVAGHIRERVFDAAGYTSELMKRDRDAEFAAVRGSRDNLLTRLSIDVARAREMLGSRGGMALDLLRVRSYSVLGGIIQATSHSILFDAARHTTGHTQEITALTRLQLGSAYQFAHRVPPNARPQPKK
jgi:hypothetical protein